MRTRAIGATLVLAATVTASAAAFGEPKTAPSAAGATPARAPSPASAPPASPAASPAAPSAPTAPSGATPASPATATTAASAAGAPTVVPAPSGAAPAAPSASASSEPATPAPPAADAPPGPPAGPPPHYYVEPAPPPGDGVYEPPPPPPYEPPPPAPPDRRAPKTALWLGVRPSWFVPFGSLWIDGFSGPSGIYYRRRTFSNYAAPGPGAELDVGARFSRRYMVFALYQHAALGAGNLDDTAFGGQEHGATNFYGVGLRFSTDPASIGFALELALGYRDFRAYWSDGTKLEMTDGILDARIGLGADIRLTRFFTLDPMLVIGGGSFGTRKWSGSVTEDSTFASPDEAGEYGTLELQLGAHFDVY